MKTTMSESCDNMSDKSETGSDNGNHSDICRDYQRNMCKRGKRCKYHHPDEAKSAEVNISEYTFCHDFQNNGCRRANCKFLHCTREEEDEARVTGELPPRVVQAASIGIGVNPAQVIAKGGVPICKDFLKGNCRRGNMCKYRHVSSDEYEFLQRTQEGRDMFPCNTDPRFERFEIHSDVKRRRLDPDFPNEGCRPFSVFQSLPPNSKPLRFQLIEDENVVLRKKVDDLKKQVADLTATNEVLLEQNSRYRVSKPNILESYSYAGVQSAFQASSLSHLNTNLAQQISLNNNAMNIMQQQQQQHQSQQRHTLLQQRLFHEDIAAGQRSMSAPLMLNTALRSIDPPIVSLPQTMVHIQPSSNKNVSPNILDVNASLVSYPIMSQGMRMSVGNCTR